MDEKKIFSKYRFVIVILIYLAGVILNIVNYIMALFLTDIASAYNVTAATAGYSRSILALFQGVGMLFVCAPLMKKFGAKKSMTISLCLATVGCLVTAFAPNFILHLAGRALVGIGFGVMASLGTGMFAMWCPTKEKPMVMTFQTVCNSLFISAAYSVAIPVYNAIGNSFKGFNIILLIMCAAIFVLWIFFGRDNKAYLEYIAEQKKQAAEKADGAAQLKPAKSGMAAALTNKSVLAVTAVVALMSIASNAISTYLPTYYSTVKAYSAEVSSTYAGLISLGSIPGAFIIGFVTTFIKSRKTVSFLCLIGLALFMVGYLALGTPVLIIACLVCYGALSSGAYVPIKTFIIEIGKTDPAAAANAFSVVFGVGYFLGFVIPSITGAISKAFGFGPAMYCFAALFLAAAACTFLLKEEKA